MIDTAVHQWADNAPLCTSYKSERAEFIPLAEERVKRKSALHSLHRRERRGRRDDIYISIYMYEREKKRERKRERETRKADRCVCVIHTHTGCREQMKFRQS